MNLFVARTTILLRGMMVALCLQSCSGPGDLKPETAEGVFRRISETLRNARTIKLEFTYSQIDHNGRFKDETPGTLILKDGNKQSVGVRLFDEGPFAEFELHYTSDGVKWGIFWPDQRTCRWWDVPEELTAKSKDDLLLGVSPLFSRGNKWGEVGLSNNRRLPSGLTLGQDAEGHKTISYFVCEGTQGFPPVHYCLWYDPGTFALVRAVSGQDRDQMSWTETLSNVAFSVDLPDGLFKLPPEDLDPGRLARTKSEFVTLRTALDFYAIDNKDYPTTQQGMEALLREPTDPRPSNWKGPYLKNSDLLKDPWGNPYIYRNTGSGIDSLNFVLSSSGPDGMPGTEDDIVSRP